MRLDGCGRALWLRLFSPLMVMALPAWLLGPYLTACPAWLALGFAGLEWSVWTGFAVLLVVWGTHRAYPQPNRFACVATWLVAALSCSGLAGLAAYANSVLLPHTVGGAAVLGLLGLVAAFSLMLSPAVAAARCPGPVESLRFSLVLMASDWRRPARLLVVVTAAVCGALLVGWALGRSAAVPWGAAQRLVTSVLLYLFLLPAVGLVYEAVFAGESSARTLRLSDVPLPVRAASAVASPAMLAAACYFLLLGVVPVSLQIAGAPTSPSALVVGFFIPLSPVRAALLLLPGLACGWLATSTVSARCAAGAAGLVYVLLCTHIPLGLMPFERWNHVRLYTLALCLYAAVGLLGGALRNYTTSRRGERAAPR